MIETTTIARKSEATSAAVTVYAVLMIALIAGRETLRTEFGMRTSNN
jgi:hypothetical protein